MSAGGRASETIGIMVRRSGYWRESDGSPVTAPESWEIWAGHAYKLLTTVARRYHAVITYGEVGEKVQAASGIRTFGTAAQLDRTCTGQGGPRGAPARRSAADGAGGPHR
jgi:hypothetical protein